RSDSPHDRGQAQVTPVLGGGLHDGPMATGHTVEDTDRHHGAPPFGGHPLQPVPSPHVRSLCHVVSACRHVPRVPPAPCRFPECHAHEVVVRAWAGRKTTTGFMWPGRFSPRAMTVPSGANRPTGPSSPEELGAMRLPWRIRRVSSWSMVRTGKAAATARSKDTWVNSSASWSSVRAAERS